MRVSVIDRNDPPVFGEEQLELVVSGRILKNGLVVATLPLNDIALDADGDALTFSIAGDALRIDATGKIVVANQNAIKDAFNSAFMYKTTITVSDGELSQAIELTLYDDHQPYVEDVRGYLVIWSLNANSLSHANQFVAKDAVDKLAKLIKEEMKTFSDTSVTSQSLSWFAFGSGTEAGVGKMVMKIVVETLSDKKGEGYEAVLKEIQARIQNAYVTDLATVRLISEQEIDKLSKLVGTTALLPQNERT